MLHIKGFRDSLELKVTINLKGDRAVVSDGCGRGGTELTDGCGCSRMELTDALEFDWRERRDDTCAGP